MFRTRIILIIVLLTACITGLKAQNDQLSLGLRTGHNEIFELERHYQPSFIAECRHYPLPELGIIFGLGYKPSGMFNMSADYYQTFLNLGLCYRW